jgi:hypothetical protein
MARIALKVRNFSHDFEKFKTLKKTSLQVCMGVGVGWVGVTGGGGPLRRDLPHHGRLVRLSRSPRTFRISCPRGVHNSTRLHRTCVGVNLIFFMLL